MAMACRFLEHVEYLSDETIEKNAEEENTEKLKPVTHERRSLVKRI